MMTKTDRNKSRRSTSAAAGYLLYITLKESVNLPAAHQDPVVNTAIVAQVGAYRGERQARAT